MALLAKDGATTLKFLVEASYTREDLLQIGILRPHVESVLKAIKAVSAGPQEGVVGSAIARFNLPKQKIIPKVDGGEVLTDTSPLGEAAGRSSGTDTCEALIRALEKKHQDPKVLLGLLKTMADMTENWSDNTISRRLGELGACQRFIEIMCDWYHDAQILECAMCCTSYLPCCYGNSNILGARGACERVVAVLTAFPRHRDI